MRQPKCCSLVLRKCLDAAPTAPALQVRADDGGGGRLGPHQPPQLASLVTGEELADGGLKMSGAVAAMKSGGEAGCFGTMGQSGSKPLISMHAAPHDTPLPGRGPVLILRDIISCALAARLPFFIAGLLLGCCKGLPWSCLQLLASPSNWRGVKTSRLKITEHAKEED